MDEDDIDEQEQKNQSEGFFKKSKQAQERAFNKNQKKEAIKKLIKNNPEAKVIFIILVIIATVFLSIILLGGFYFVQNDLTIAEASEAKQKSMTISYDGQVSTDANGNTPRIIVKPTDSKDAYEIENSYTDDELKEIKALLNESSVDTSKFTDFEVAVLGAMVENGLDLDDYTTEELKCFPYFIKAETCTQYLDLRLNNDKIKNEEYSPEQLDDLDEAEVPGVVLVQRTNSEDNNSIILEYKIKSEFDELVNNNNKDAINYFTINDSGNLVIAKWDHITVKVNDKNPDVDIEDEIESERDEDIISTEEIAYSQYIKKYTMPFEFLVQLLVITEDPDFCKEVADVVLGSKIVINIQEEKTVTDTKETRNYTIHNKDEKRVDYEVKAIGETIATENGYFLEYDEDEADPNNKKTCTNYSTEKKKVIVHTIYTSNSYSFEISEADIWIAHYIKTYTKQEAKIGPTETYETEVLGKYEKKADKTTDKSEDISGDKDAQKFINETISNYTPKIIVPSVYIASSTGEDGKNYKAIYKTPSNTTIYPEYAGYTMFEEQKSEDGTSLGYGLPGAIIIGTSPVAATETTKQIPTLNYIYAVNSDESAYILQTAIDPLVECEVLKLNIKDFKRIDVATETSTTITEYPADPAPTTSTHIYATKDGKPGSGHGYKEFEKFLVAYDNNKDARDMMNSADSWLFEAMEDNENTVNMVDTVKYLLYMYDGTNYGVTELDLGDVFEETNMSTFGGSIYGGSIEEKVWFTLREQGYSEEAVAAVMGNIYGESGFRADAVESNGEGYGLCQWSFGRKTQLINYAKSKGKDWTDEDIQIEFLIGEITKGGGANGYAKFQMSGTHYGYTYSSWKDATDVSEATKAFMAVFERPNMNVAHTDRRIQAAKDYLEQFHGKERSGGEFTSSNGDIIGTYTSTITGKTFTIFNQTMSGLGSSKGRQWTGYCNKCVAACIATGYNGGNLDDALNRTLSWNSILSNTANTNAYFRKYGLKAKVSGGGSYSVNNLRSALTSGKYVAIWFNGEANGKSGQNYCHSIHWIGVIGYKNENGKEQIFISDSAHGGTGWKDLDEFESCKSKIQYFTVVSEK